MIANKIRFVVTLGELAEVPGTPYAYWAPKSLRDLFQKYPPLDRDVARQPDKPKIADVKQGLATADDLRFTRYWWEVPVEQIGTSREETYQGKKWVPFAKGGKPFFHDIQLVVNWEKNGEEIKAYIVERYPYLQGKWEWVVKNESFYFREGLVGEAGHEFSAAVREGRLGVAFFPAGAIFSTKASGFFLSDGSLLAFLGFLRSRLPQMLVNLLREHGSGQHGEVAKLPINYAILESEKLTIVSFEAHDRLREWATGHEKSTHFFKPWILQVWNMVKGLGDGKVILPTTTHPLARDFMWRYGIPEAALEHYRRAIKEGFSLFALAQACVVWESELRRRIDEIQRQIDDEVYKLYGISEEDRAYIEAELSGPLEAEGEEEEENERREGGEEEAVAEGIMPAEEHIKRLVHFLVHEVIKADPDGIVPLYDTYRADGRLERGLVCRVIEKLKEVFGEEALITIDKEMRGALGEPLDSWLESEFFRYHVTLFRLRPVIWQIVSNLRGKPAFSCFVYWHKLDSDTLHKIQEVYLRPALENARVEAERQARQFSEQQSANMPLKVLREAEKVWQRAQERYRELQELKERIQRLFQPHTLRVESRSEWVKEKVNEIVGKGYLPNRDYGVRVNIEPLKQAGILPGSTNRVKG